VTPVGGPHANVCYPLARVDARRGVVWPIENGWMLSGGPPCETSRLGGEHHGYAATVGGT
jgi:hypothetical protein